MNDYYYLIKMRLIRIHNQKKNTSVN